MRVQLGTYRINVPFIQDFLERNKDRDICKNISEVAVALNVPVVVVAHYAIELSGPNPAVTKQIESLVRFYQYTEIVE